MPLLQVQFISNQNDWRSILLLVLITVISIFTLLRYSRMRGSSLENHRFRHYSKRIFRKEAINIGLDKLQIKMLEDYIKAYSVRRPFDLFTVRREMNDVLSKAIKDIHHQDISSAEIEKQKQNIYQIKHKIDRNISFNNQPDSTYQLKPGQNITFQKENGLRNSSIILANLREFYCAQAPRELNDNKTEWKKGQKIKVLIWGMSGDEIVFESKFLGYNKIRNTSSLMLQHAKRSKRLVNRKFRRRTINGHCLISPVSIVRKTQGKKKTERAVVIKDKVKTATIIDISPGGCSIGISNPLPLEEFIRINFEISGNRKVVIYGKIIDIRYIRKSKAVMHIMFNRASTANLNLINEYVYGFK